MALRGCYLRNTEYVVGLVVYTGRDTKIMLNNTPSRIKYSKMFRLMSKQIILLFILLNLLSIISAIIDYFWIRQN
jgi:magnesium-transporting ATPase (P-type)